jgi:hypothetical protein
MIASRRGRHGILLNFTDEALMAKVQGQSISVAPRDVQVLNSDES